MRHCDTLPDKIVWRGKTQFLREAKTSCRFFFQPPDPFQRRDVTNDRLSDLHKKLIYLCIRIIDQMWAIQNFAVWGSSALNGLSGKAPRATREIRTGPDGNIVIEMKPTMIDRLIAAIFGWFLTKTVFSRVIPPFSLIKSIGTIMSVDNLPSGRKFGSGIIDRHRFCISSKRHRQGQYGPQKEGCIYQHPALLSILVNDGQP